MRALFISEQKLKDNSRINANIDNKLITPLIRESQDFYILPVIGTGLYNELMTQINASTLTSLNETLLLDYVQPCLIKYVEYEAPHYLNFKFTNSSIAKKNTDESVPVSLDEMVKITDHIKQKAEWYAERVTKYLIANLPSYPLYSNPGSNVDTIRPKRTNYTGGLYLGICNTCYCEQCICMTNMRTSSPN